MSKVRNGQRTFRGERLVEAANAKFLTGSALAREMEVPERTITRWRQGTQPRFSSVLRLAEVLDVEPQFFYEPPKEEAA